MTQDSGQSSIAINDFIQLNDNRNRSIKKLNKSKPKQQIPADMLFEGFDQMIEGIKQQRRNNQIDFSYKEQNNIQPQIKKPSLNAGFYLKKLIGIVKQDKKQQKKIKQAQNQITQKKKKRKNNRQAAEKVNKNLTPRKKNKKKQDTQQKPNQIISAKQFKQSKNLNYVDYNNVQMQKQPQQDQKAYNQFKNFEDIQKKHNHQLKTIQRLQRRLKLTNQQEKRKGQIKTQKKDKQQTQNQQKNVKKRPQKSHKKKQKGQENKQQKKQHKIVQKKEKVIQKQIKNHPKLQKFKVDTTKLAPKKQKVAQKQVLTGKPQLNRPFKGKKQRIDPRKQPLKSIVQVYSNKFKLKQFSNRITPNLFANEIQFASAYLYNQITAKYYSRCLVTPYDQRAFAIILAHKFPKEYLMDQSQPYIIQSSEDSQLVVFYNKIYDLNQVQYYQQYLKTILKYNRELPRSFRFHFDQVMKERLSKGQTPQQKQDRKQVQRLLQNITKAQKQNQLMYQLKRQMQEKSKVENQQQLKRQNKLKLGKIGTTGFNFEKNKNQENYKGQQRQKQGVLLIKKIKQKEKKKTASLISSKNQNKRRVIVIDQRANLLDLDAQSDPQFQSSGSQDQQLSDSMKSSNQESQEQEQSSSKGNQSSSSCLFQPQMKRNKQISQLQQNQSYKSSQKQEENQEQSQNSDNYQENRQSKQKSSNSQSYQSFDKQIEQLIVQNEQSNNSLQLQSSLSLGQGLQSKNSLSDDLQSSENIRKKKKQKVSSSQSLGSVSISMEQQSD